MRLERDLFEGSFFYLKKLSLTATNSVNRATKFKITLKLSIIKFAAENYVGYCFYLS